MRESTLSLPWVSPKTNLPRHIIRCVKWILGIELWSCRYPSLTSMSIARAFKRSPHHSICMRIFVWCWVCLSVYLSVCLSVCLTVILPVWLPMSDLYVSNSEVRYRNCEESFAREICLGNEVRKDWTIENWVQVGPIWEENDQLECLWGPLWDPDAALTRQKSIPGQWY